MVATLRALLSLFMLLGFYFVALIQLAGAAVLAIWIATKVPSVVAINVTKPLFAALVLGAGVALWKAIKARNEPMPGVTLAPHDAPRLWHVVQELARDAATRPPDEIRVVGDVNAAVSEHAKLLGLIPGRRYLYLGLPLLQALSTAQTRAVLAHELGHYSSAHTRLGAVAYRGRLAIGGTIGRISKWNPVGMIFRLYARIYLLVDNAVSRRQELEADAAAVRAAGKRAAIGALTEVNVAAMAYNFYLGGYVAPGAEFGLLPDNIFANFRSLIEARQDELVRIRQEAPALEKGSLWDTHPPLSARIAAIEALPESAVNADPTPAVELLPDPDRIGQALQAIVVEGRGRQVLPWEEFRTTTATSSLQAQADMVFREVSRRLGQPNCGLPQVFAALEAGRAAELGEAFAPNATREEAPGEFAELLTALLALAAIRSGAGTWKLSWSGPAELVGQDGKPLDLREVAKLAVSPGTVPEAQKRLGDMGIAIGSAALVEERATVRGAEVIAGLANVKFDGADTDLYALDNGFIAVPAHGKTDQGRKRMLAFLQSTPLQDMAKVYPFVPYEEIRKVVFTKKIPLRAALELHDGRSIELREGWTGESLHRQSNEVVVEVLQRFTEET